MKKRVYYVIILVAFIVVIFLLFILSNKLNISPEEKACLNSGGTITTNLCCGSVDAFPNTCTIGSCGCSPAASHQVKSCNCEEGKCFNGTQCVVQG